MLGALRRLFADVYNPWHGIWALLLTLLATSTTAVCQVAPAFTQVFYNLDTSEGNPKIQVHWQMNFQPVGSVTLSCRAIPINPHLEATDMTACNNAPTPVTSAGVTEVVLPLSLGDNGDLDAKVSDRAQFSLTATASGGTSVQSPYLAVNDLPHLQQFAEFILAPPKAAQPLSVEAIACTVYDKSLTLLVHTNHIAKLHFAASADNQQTRTTDKDIDGDGKVTIGGMRPEAALAPGGVKYTVTITDGGRTLYSWDRCDPTQPDLKEGVTLRLDKLVPETDGLHAYLTLAKVGHLYYKVVKDEGYGFPTPSVTDHDLKEAQLSDCRSTDGATRVCSDQKLPFKMDFDPDAKYKLYLVGEAAGAPEGSPDYRFFAEQSSHVFFNGFREQIADSFDLTIGQQGLIISAQTDTAGATLGASWVSPGQTDATQEATNNLDQRGDTTAKQITIPFRLLKPVAGKPPKLTLVLKDSQTRRTQVATVSLSLTPPTDKKALNDITKLQTAATLPQGIGNLNTKNWKAALLSGLGAAAKYFLPLAAAAVAGSSPEHKAELSALPLDSTKLTGGPLAFSEATYGNGPLLVP